MSKHEASGTDRDDLESPFDTDLVNEFVKAGVPVDRLAYSAQFEEIFKKLEAKGDKRDRAAMYQRLLNLRKSGRLPLVHTRRSA